MTTLLEETRTRGGADLTSSDTAEVAPRRRKRRAVAEPAREERSGRMRIPTALLALTVAGSVLAVGTVHLPVLLVVAVFAFAGAAFALRERALAGKSVAPPLPALVCVALALFTLAQATPMPMSWLRVLAPTNADVWDRCLLPLGEPGPAWAPISLDPGASLVEALKWAVYAAVLTTAATLAARKGAALGVTIVFVSATLAALTGLGHGVVGATKVWGLYRPDLERQAWHMGPLLNPNNLAGYLNLGALAGLGVALSQRPLLPRWMVVPAVALLIGMVVMTASRGGVATLPLGVLGLAVAHRLREGRGREGGPGAAGWLAIGAVLGGAVLAALGGTYATWAELYDKDVSKLEMAFWARSMISAHPVFGVGRGAFETVFPAHNPARGYSLYTHAENFFVQWATEWGLPVTIAALATLAWAFRPRRVGLTKSAVVAGAWMGVAALLVQNVVDLGLEIPSVCIAVATLLGSIWGAARPPGGRESSPEEAAPTRWAWGAPLALGATLAGLAALVVVGQGGHDATDDRATIRAALQPATPLDAGALASLRAELRRDMLRHPAEPYFPLVGGALAHRYHDQSPIPWIQRTLERGQLNARAHVLLAEVLAARGATRQALLEVRLAVENEPAMAATVAPLALKISRSFDDLAGAAPEGAAGAPLLLGMASQLTTARDEALRERLDAEILIRDPDAIEPRLRAIDARLAALEPDSKSDRCVAREPCRADVEHHIEAITRALPGTSLGARLTARLLLVEGHPEEAVGVLEKRCDKVSDRTECLQARAQAAAKIKDPGPIEVATKDLLGTGCPTNVACADLAVWLAGLRSSRGDQGAALALLSRAARLDPTDSRLRRLGDAAAAAGSHSLAADAFDKASRLHGADPTLKQRAEQERAAAVGRLLQ